MQVLKIKNYLLANVNSVKLEIEPTLQDYLFALELTGKKSWNRTKFINNYLLATAKQIEETRKSLTEKYTKKDAEGKLTYLTKEGKETSVVGEGSIYNIEDKEKFATEFNELMNDELIIDVTPANSAIISSIREGVGEDKKTYSSLSATKYSEYCESLEPVEMEVGKKESKKGSKKEN